MDSDTARRRCQWWHGEGDCVGDGKVNKKRRRRKGLVEGGGGGEEGRMNYKAILAIEISNNIFSIPVE